MRISDLSSDVCSSDLAAQADHLGLVLQPIPDVGADIELVVEDAGPAGPVAVNRVLAPDAATGTARAVLVEAGGDRLAGLALRILLENPHHDLGPGRVDQIGSTSCRETVCPYV